MPGINKNITSGFTLIESMVAVTIFALLIVSATDIFLSIIRSQRNTLSSKNAQESVSYALEVMTKELRMAKIDDGSCGQQANIYSVSPNGEEIKFINYQDVCVTYSLENNRLKIKRDDGQAYMTPPNITIGQLNFHATHLDIANQQPLVTIRFVLSYLNTETGQQSLQIQTSVSSRFYENYQFAG